MKSVVHALLSGALGVALVMAAGNTTLRAADDEDEAPTFDQRILRNIMSGIGIQVDRPNIEYRERSPLVVPPARDLPPPESEASVKNPAWPNDPDLKRRREAAASKKKVESREDDAFWTGRPLRPDELAGGRSNAPPVGQRTADVDATHLSRSQLGDKGSIFSWKGLFGGGEEETTTFTREPPRTSLIEPPSGYRTPSPGQPYGLNAKASAPKATNYLEQIGTGQ